MLITLILTILVGGTTQTDINRMTAVCDQAIKTYNRVEINRCNESINKVVSSDKWEIIVQNEHFNAEVK